MTKEEEQQRFLELSSLFNKNNAIKHIILLEQKIADYESSRVELPVGMPSRTLSESAYKKINEFRNVGELRKILEPFTDEMPVVFINQPRQHLYLSIDLEFGSQLGFQ